MIGDSVGMTKVGRFDVVGRGAKTGGFAGLPGQTALIGGRVAHVVVVLFVVEVKSKSGFFVVLGKLSNNDGGCVGAAWSGGWVGIGGGQPPKPWKLF